MLRERERERERESKAFNGFSVDDIQKAKEFYGPTLGLKVSQSNDLLRLHLAVQDYLIRQ